MDEPTDIDFDALEPKPEPKPVKKLSGQPLPPEQIAAARAIYEANPKMTLLGLSEQTGLSFGSIKRYSRHENWQKKTDFQRLQETYKENLPANANEVQKREAIEQLTVEHALTERKRLMERHRKEWDLPRRLAYEAVKNNNFETAKLAKISSETLRNIQEMERKAWGIEKAEPENNITVVIERG
ncbi:hypothetical protein PN823_004445 [Enterobacter hormaechei]|nr:hypothetical protein [Enterobacter hormaechei]